jgi:hypothetical protein
MESLTKGYIFFQLDFHQEAGSASADDLGRSETKAEL